MPKNLLEFLEKKPITKKFNFFINIICITIEELEIYVSILLLLSLSVLQFLFYVLASIFFFCLANQSKECM